MDTTIVQPANPIMGLLKQLLLMLGRRLPQDVQPIIAWVADLIGNLQLPSTDPRLAQAAELVEQLLVDIQALEGMDATTREKARLILENRFGRAWIDAGLSGGGI